MISKKNQIFLPLYQREVGKKGRKKNETKRKRLRERQARKILFPPIFKKKGNFEVSANNVITKSVYIRHLLLHIIESHHAFHIASSTLLKLPHH